MKKFRTLSTALVLLALLFALQLTFTSRSVAASQGVLLAQGGEVCPPGDEGCEAGGENDPPSGGTLNIDCSSISPDLEAVNGTCVPKRTYTCTGGSLSLACTKSLGEVIGVVIRILLILSGLVALILVIYGGYLFMTAGGDTEKATKGRRAVTQAVIGLVIIGLSYTIVQVVVDAVVRGNIVPGGGGTTTTTGPRR